MGDDFKTMFGNAARLKTEQLKAARPHFERSASFHKHSLYLENDLKETRALPIDALLDAASAMKDEGNVAYERGAYADAYRAYERALGCLRYFEAIDPNWRNGGGFTDETLREVFTRTRCDTPERAVRLHDLMLSCYLNIALVRLAERTEYAEAIDACNEAIALDPSSAKAFFRRARARYEPLSCTATDQELAVRDLAAASRLAPADATIRRELARLRASERKQRDTDRVTFDGLFERGPALYDKDEERKYLRRKEREDEEASRAYGKNGMDRLRTMIAEHDAAGNTAKADELRAQVEQARQAAIAKHEGDMNWAEPSEEMVRDAERAGIDLRDPSVREVFLALSAERKRKEGTPLTAAEEAIAARASGSKSKKGWKRWLTTVSAAFIVLQLLQLLLPMLLGSARLAYGLASGAFARGALGASSGDDITGMAQPDAAHELREEL
ncbi:hypothetical protein KFE25_003865 [Diacronema lutheri]|uniref:Uncharacterized protein n=1 Tax=Diacronema lutheri TaxID=2081491 RepID=A0A8J5XL59_DIALT|nr:hypothetical protein KFE25_003865 [Diacronema lutheri]